MFFQRLKNLWKLSAYEIGENAQKEKILVKNLPTIENRLAQIIKDEPNYFEEEEELEI